MSLAKRFKFGFGSCFGSGANVQAPREVARTPYDFSQHTEHNLWRLAVAAAEGTKRHPTPEDALIPWSNPAAAGGTSDVCTLDPVSSARHSTLFLRTRFSAATVATRLITDYFDDSTFSLNQDSQSTVLLVPVAGGAPELVIEVAPGSYTYGHVLALTSTTAVAQEALEYLHSIAAPGWASILTHNKMETIMRTRLGTMKLTMRTGLQKSKALTKMEKVKAPSAKSLGTVFELEFERAQRFSSPSGHPAHIVGDCVVARAVIAYRDASGWPSIGPTIQSIEVRRDYQGTGLAQDLFNAIERWFVNLWKLDTVVGLRCLKATQLQDYVVDRIPVLEEDDPAEENHVLTDKKFLYEENFFGCNYPNPTDPLGQLGTMVPPETHAIKYYPPTQVEVRLPTKAYSKSATVQGWRSCDNCWIPQEDLGADLFVCNNCTLPKYWRAHYCGRQCQEAHWVIHKLCCGKSYDEILAGKKACEEKILAANNAAAVATAAAAGPPERPRPGPAS